MKPSSWLFVKGDQSVRVVRPPAVTVLNVSGPGHARARYSFNEETAMQAYQIELAEQFSTAGWVLVGENVDRRSGLERRTAARTTTDRRLAGRA